MTAGAFCLSERMVIRYGYLFRAFPVPGISPERYCRQRLQLFLWRKYCGQAGERAVCHADDRRVLLCHILAEAVAGLPLHLYRYKEDGGKEKASDHPLYLLLHDEPNPEMSSFVFQETLMTHLLLWGNAYAQIIRNGKGEVIALSPNAGQDDGGS